MKHTTMGRVNVNRGRGWALGWLGVLALVGGGLGGVLGAGCVGAPKCEAHQDCLQSEWCEQWSGRCKPNPCLERGAGELVECHGERLVTCDATGMPAVTECGEPGCDPAREGCRDCVPFSGKYCDATSIRNCDKDGVGVLVEECPLGCELHDPDGADGAGVPEPRCKPCEPGEVGCYDDLLVECDADGEPLSIVPCSWGCDGGRLDCDECRPSTHTCRNIKYAVRCGADGLIIEDEHCEYACVEEGAPGESARCTECDPGTTACQGDDEVTCDAEGYVASRESCPHGCNPDRERCNECSPGQDACEGDERVVCNADGEITFTESCAYGCDSGRVECNECVPSQMACEGDTQVTCGADGRVDSQRSCLLGCYAAEGRCYEFVPANLTAGDLTAGTADLSVTDPAAAVVIDTTACTVTVDGADETSAAARTASQANGVDLCVLPYRNVVLYAPVTVGGDGALALVASGQITISNEVDGSAYGAQAGPGGASAGDGYAGNGQEPSCTQYEGGGGGGGGNAAAGGDGGDDKDSSPLRLGGDGGPAIGDASLSPLYAGGAGGECGARPGSAGGGGGAIQLAAGVRVRLSVTMACFRPRLRRSLDARNL